MAQRLTDRGRALLTRGEKLTKEDHAEFREAFLDWRRSVEQSVDEETAREVRRLVGPTGLFGGGGPEAFARSGGVGRFGRHLNVQSEWLEPMTQLLALVEVELPGPSASGSVQDVERALDAATGIDAASLATALQVLFPHGRLETIRAGREAFVSNGWAAVVDHVPDGTDPETALHAFLEDLAALVVHPSETTEVVFVLWCDDDTVDARLAKLQTELSAPDGRIVRTHTVRHRSPPGG